jgi:exosortase/archaeosortase family protein
MPLKLAVIILTFNEEKNLVKCLESVKKLSAPIFIVDSYSTDNTEIIAKSYNAHFIQNKFSTHTLQWKFALQNLPEDIDWVLGLDADQSLSERLENEINKMFNSTEDIPYDGYYIRRRNYFLNKWIRFGGYQNRYLLKLFKRDKVYLDESELMDHHFYVNGSTKRLKNELSENNYKENLDFWKSKHVKYAELQAKEEFEKLLKNKGNLFGNQDQRRLYLKSIWNLMPLFIRPLLYFIYRYFLLGGFLDGKIGAKFHYLQAYWYRRKVDENIYLLKSKKYKYYQELFFSSRFIFLFTILYGFNIFFIGLTGEGGEIYSSFVNKYFNYIRWLRESIIYFSSQILSVLNYDTIRLPFHLKIINGVRVGIGYDCLGYGLMSMHIALALAYPFRMNLRIKFLLYGLLAIYIINVIRIALVGLVYTEYKNINIDHHLVFNIVAYILIFSMMVYSIKLNSINDNTRT